MNTSFERRFWAKVNRTGTCWNWTGAIGGGGYGHIKISGSVAPAHRVSYELANGAIPAGLEVDHLCRNRRCVRPDHLQAVEKTVNVLRGVGPTALNARATTCKSGHLFTDENTYTQAGRRRQCRECNRAAVARYKDKKRNAKESAR